MPERLYQGRFDEHLEPLNHQDVTPTGFTGLSLPHHRLKVSPGPASEVGRFVREAQAGAFITSPEAAAEYLHKNIYTPFDHFDQEELWVLLLDTKNKITHEAMVYRGTVNTAQIRVAELFKAAVRVNATGLIMSHCHPSGDPTPSPEDVHVTRCAVESGTLLGIELLDHIVVGSQAQWVSMKERGLGFNI